MEIDHAHVVLHWSCLQLLYYNPTYHYKNNNMKTTIALCLFIFSIAFAKAQEITKDTYLAFKNDNVSSLKSQLDPSQLNECYAVKETSYTLLSMAIKMKATDCLTYLLAQENIDTDQRCGGKTPLMYAAKYNQLEMVKALLNAGADRSIKNRGLDVLDYAKKYKHLDIVNYLMSE